MWVAAVVVPLVLLLMPLALHRIESSLGRVRRARPAAAAAEPTVDIPLPRDPISRRSRMACVPAPRGA